MWRKLASYGLGALAAFVAWALRMALNDWFPPGFPYLTFFPAVVITAYLAGLRPAILCAVLSGTAAWYFFIPPFGSFDISFPTSVALAFFAFVVAVDIFFIDGMQRALRLLEEERARYAALAESRDLLYRELHHRVSNNLQVVGGLLRLQSAGITDGGARRALAEAAERVGLIAKIQRELHNAVGDPAPFRAFAEVVLTEASEAAGARISLTIEGGEAAVHPDQATPVTLVMLECFNNALEHGFGEGAGGRIRVDLDQTLPVHVLSVRDNGRGPPQEFDHAASESLGLRIVRAMAKQLDGKFAVVREEGWTVCTLSYPAKAH